MPDEAKLSTSSPVVEMERAIVYLALELPAEVWEDVRDKWHAAREALVAERDRLQERFQKETLRTSALLRAIRHFGLHFQPCPAVTLTGANGCTCGLTLLAEGRVDEFIVIEHIGWQSARHTSDMLSPNVHKHYFDSWDDEVVAAHVDCLPVFVHRGELPQKDLSDG